VCSAHAGVFASFDWIWFVQAARYGLDGSGVRRFTSFYLALKEINDKNDGVADSLLPHTNLTFAFRDSKRSSGDAFFGALELGTEVFNNQGVSAIIGAASSGPSKSAGLVTAQLQIPQISYSATSPDLSDGQQYSYFLRTPPSDAYEGEGIADMLRNFMGYTKIATVNSQDSCARASPRYLRCMSPSDALWCGWHTEPDPSLWCSSPLAGRRPAWCRSVQRGRLVLWHANSCRR
jgi:hypothetical protein